MSAPAPAPAAKPWPPYVVPLIGVGLVAAVVGAVVVFGGSGTTMSDGSDVTAPDPNLEELAPGVKVRDLKAGTGEPCPPGAKVKAHYTGWLVDGTSFDSSRGAKPVEFNLSGGVVPGWQVGIPGMKVGGVRKLVISPEMAYGSARKGSIPPNSTLIFEVELLAFSPGKGGGGGAAPTKLSDGTAPGAEDAAMKDIGGGLKVRDLKVGTGAECPPGASVVAHYTGWLLNGQSFDSSVARGEPSPFSLEEVVVGWQRGIPGMKVGGVRKLVIPPELAYGSRAKPGIPPNSTLVFEVELVGIQ
ncbi:MAG TPA: FKBP-type peptidyl-prolyl cis-trans isomerase [Urbifossiella sp.]|nr:FKBP-type peptidyl-prolyl cis-trans isomerase [Urbifossiella sp.]